MDRFMVEWKLYGVEAGIMFSTFCAHCELHLYYYLYELQDSCESGVTVEQPRNVNNYSSRSVLRKRSTFYCS